MVLHRNSVVCRQRAGETTGQGPRFFFALLFLLLGVLKAGSAPERITEDNVTP